jgi:hypothetical protein
MTREECGTGRITGESAAPGRSWKEAGVSSGHVRLAMRGSQAPATYRTNRAQQGWLTDRWGRVTSLESRTLTACSLAATSTHSPPSFELYELLNQDRSAAS